MDDHVLCCSLVNCLVSFLIICITSFGTFGNGTHPEHQEINLGEDLPPCEQKCLSCMAFSVCKHFILSPFIRY